MCINARAKASGNYESLFKNEEFCRCRSVVVSVVELFAPATTWIPIEIPMENLNWNSHGRRSKLLQRHSSIQDVYKRQGFTHCELLTVNCSLLT